MRIEGESAQAKGADGARRAKRWLESTTRVNAYWVNPDPPAIPKLRFSWPHGGQHFSFDLGGRLKYGEFEGQEFFAEVKNYSSSADLGVHYTKFLAQCYVAYEARPERCDHFMWISWSPHSISRWKELTSVETVRNAVIDHRERVLGTNDRAVAVDQIDLEVVSAVSERLWMIILSEKQEMLVISPEHRGLIEAHVIKSGDQ